MTGSPDAADAARHGEERVEDQLGPLLGGPTLLDEALELVETIAAYDSDFADTRGAQRFDLVLQDRAPGDLDQALRPFRCQRQQTRAKPGGEKDGTVDHCSALCPKSVALMRHTLVRLAVKPTAALWTFTQRRAATGDPG